MIRHLEKVLVVLLVFLFPTQLAIHFWPSWAFVFGIRIDYLSPTIYLTDLLIIPLLFFGYKGIFRYKKYLFLFIMVALVNIYFSTNQMVSLYKWIKILEIGMLSLYFSQKLKFVGKVLILNTLFASLCFFSVIGIAQFLLSNTIGGLLYWLGERSFTISTPGIALYRLFGTEVLRAYSTFPHPNALAGFLGVSVIFLLTKGYFKKKNKLPWLLLVVSCFLLTFSLSAVLGATFVLIAGVLAKNSNKLIKLTNYILVMIVSLSLLLPLIASTPNMKLYFSKNITERLDLAAISGKVIGQHFWTGSGFGTFIINMVKIKPAETSSWLLQPVHNIFLLIFGETGIFGLYILALYFSKSLKIYPLVFLFILITGFMDHYWLDSQQNLLLISLISGLAFKQKK
ncbi:MAG TPA: O-antigen ligase family protein [Patescibacteria group bacterium]|nr:O-antigen ligase family protein [Patescibacteria group bacterium]